MLEKNDSDGIRMDEPGPGAVEREVTRVSTKVWAVIAILAAAIRLYRLDHFSYWLDEILQSFAIHNSWRGLFASLRWQGLQAPLDYVIGKLVEAAGPSDAVRKLPAVLWGTGTVVAMGGLVARRAGRAAGIAVAALLALSPFHVHYSQELRPYSLGLFLLALSLLSLDRYLAEPGPRRLAALYLSCLATAYALYVSALVLAVAAGAIVAEDCFSADPRRRRAARRFLRTSPLFAAALWLGYLPWWSTFLTGLRSPAVGAVPAFSAARVVRFFSFFGFGHSDWQPLGVSGFLFVAGTIFGAVLACRREGARFAVAWAAGGLGLLELMEHRHPVFDSIFHYLPAGIALVVLFSIALAELLRRPGWRGAGAALLLLSFSFEISSLAEYFRSGRPDWRPAASFLRSHHGSERIVTDSQWTQLCAAYYVFGPEWLCCGDGHGIVSLNGDPAPIAWLQEPGKNLWLVTSNAAGGSARLTGVAERLAVARFPRAEGAIIARIPPR